MLYFIQEIEVLGDAIMNFGDKLKELRKEKGLSQKDLANILGVTQRTISYYESSNTPPANAETVAKLAEALNVRLDELATDIGNTKIHKLIDKLKNDTDKNLIHWEIFSNAFANKTDESNWEYTITYKDVFDKQNFPQYSNAKLDYEHSYFYIYKSGGYLLAKFLKEDTVEFALFVLINDENYIMLANNNSIETIEDLYWSISNGASSVNNMIDDYLSRDFAKEEAERKKQEEHQTASLIPFDEEIPF